MCIFGIFIKRYARKERVFSAHQESKVIFLWLHSYAHGLFMRIESLDMCD